MRLKQQTLKIIYAVLSIVVIVTIPLIYSDIYGRLIHSTFNNAFVSAGVIAVSPSYVSGMIEKDYVKDNDIVKKGQLIALIDDTLYRAELEKNKSRLEALKMNLSQLESQSGTESFRYTELAKEMNVLKQNIKMSKLMLSYTRIVSPVNGVVAENVLHAGDSVSPSNIIMYIYDPSTVYIKAYIQLKYIRRFRLNMDVLIKTEHKIIHGKVVKIGGIDVFNVCNKKNPVVPVKIETAQKDRKILTFGVPVRLTINN